MIKAKPSRTAMMVAIRRAAHQLVDSPRVLDDPIALKIIGPEQETKLRANIRQQFGLYSRSSRAHMVARSRFAEDALVRAIKRGASQYVILGAGLDTFAYRNPYPESALKIFEVDFPATQLWKRYKLKNAGIDKPAALTFAPVDFENQTLAEGLGAAGFDSTKPAFFSWLGVIMYLTEAAIDATLQTIASTPKGGGLAFDYIVPSSELGWMEKIALYIVTRRVASASEPFRSFFEPESLHQRLAKFGFHDIDDIGSDAINERYFKGRSDKLQVAGQIGRFISVEI